jgi:hypothetical protein
MVVLLVVELVDITDVKRVRSGCADNYFGCVLWLCKKLGGDGESVSQGLKPKFHLALDVRAEARTYLTDKENSGDPLAGARRLFEICDRVEEKTLQFALPYRLRRPFVGGDPQNRISTAKAAMQIRRPVAGLKPCP